MNTHQNKIAIVTGGGSGIGFATAEKFVQNNILTIIIGGDQQKLDDAKNKLGTLCDSLSCNLNNLNEIPKLVNDIITRYGQIDILVNNAGINLKKEFTEVTDEEFQKNNTYKPYYGFCFVKRSSEMNAGKTNERQPHKYQFNDIAI